MLRDLAVENSLGPFIVKLHIPGIRQEKGRTSQAQKDDQSEQENSGKEIVTRREGVPLPVFETPHGRESSMSRAPSGVIPRDSGLRRDPKPVPPRAFWRSRNSKKTTGWHQRCSIQRGMSAMDIVDRNQTNNREQKVVTVFKYINKRREGFTLVEIMIVVAIIALLAAIAVPGFLRARKRSQATRILNDLRMIDSAVDHA